MVNQTKIDHPIVSSYIDNFIKKYEINIEQAQDEHLIFEMFINSLVLDIYTNDNNASYQDMETGNAIGIDGIAIFVADKLVTTIEDVTLLSESARKFDVDFYFIQSKTSKYFDRSDINNFYQAVVKFFDLNREKCLIPELYNFWEITKCIYNQAAKFKSSPKLHLFYISLSPSVPQDNVDIHLKADLELQKTNLKNLNMIDEEIHDEFWGIKQIIDKQKKNNTQREIVINVSKTPVSYPKNPENKIENAYFGLLKIDQLIKMISDDIENSKVLKKGIFDDNIRYYLGSDEKIEVNSGIKDQLLSDNYHLFGLLNNGITIICDEAKLNSEELTLVNYQIVNGCQTSNVIFENLEKLKTKQDIYLPVKFIATQDEDTKNAIIKGTNSQTSLKLAQIMALSSVQKAIELHYEIKNKEGKINLYYERRTNQYRDDDIQKTKIINIPTQIKCISAMYLNLPHEVSGQYGKVEKSTTGRIFREDEDLSYLDCYYVSGLCWYKVSRFVQNNEIGRKYKRAKWHIMMLFKFLLCDTKDIDNLSKTKTLNKIEDKNSKKVEKKLLRNEDEITSDLLKIVDFISTTLNVETDGDNQNFLKDRKTFERKETTSKLINNIQKLKDNFDPTSPSP